MRGSIKNEVSAGGPKQDFGKPPNVPARNIFWHYNPGSAASRVAQDLEHNCTIFLCSLDVRNIVQGGDPLYAGFFSTQGSGGYT